MDIKTILELQALAFPLIKLFGGPDIQTEFIQPGAAYLDQGAAVLHAAGNLLAAAGQAMADGVMTEAEINTIIVGYGDLVLATEVITAKLHPVDG